MTRGYAVYRDGNFCFEIRSTQQEAILWAIVNMCPPGAPATKDKREEYLAYHGIKVVKVNVVPSEPVT